MFNKIGLLLILAVALRVTGQNNSFYPVLPSSFVFNSAWINPSHITDSTRFHFKVLNVSQPRTLGTVGSYFLETEFALKINKHSSHNLGFLFTSENEGPYISKPRGYLSYSYQLFLKQNLWMSAATQVGFNSRYAKAAVVVNRNYFVHDGSFGFTIQSHTWSLGASIFHLFNTTILKSSTDLQLKRYYQFNGNYDIPIGNSEVKISSYYRYFTDIHNQIQLQCFYFLLPKLGFGPAFYSKRGIAVSLTGGIEKKLTSYHFFITYNSGLLANHNVLVQNLEIGFEIHKK